MSQFCFPDKKPIFTNWNQHHAGAHWSLACYSVCVYHADYMKFWTESHQRLLGAFGHPSSWRMPESNHDLGLNQTGVNKNIRWIFLRHACCMRSSSSVKNCNRRWASFSANFEKSIIYVLLKTPNMQLIYKNKARNHFFVVQ